MRAWTISDIHLTRMPGMTLQPPFAVPKADICIIAGDTSGTLSTALDYVLEDIEPSMPVIKVLGNHEYCGLTIDRAIARARRRAEGTNLHILENDTLVIGSTRFIGATLWTDLEVETGDEFELPVELRLEIAMQDIAKHIGDYTEINSSFPEGGRLTPIETKKRHFESREFIANELSKPFAGKTVVVTHHAPLPRSLDPRFAGSLANAAYASDLSGLIASGRPDFWIHGHVHMAFDYLEGTTRIVCNPRGFSNERGRSNFQPDLILNI